MMKIGVFPGTFDPLTLGHLQLIERAACLFDQLVIAVAQNTRKTPCIPFNDRMQLCQDTVKSLPNVSVLELEGLLVDFAKKHQANYLVRGLRTVTDFDYEVQMAQANHQLSPQLQTIFLPAITQSAYISSSLVREIIEAKADASAFVPNPVADYLRALQCR